MSKAMVRIQSHMTSNPSSVSQHAALAALRSAESDVERMREAFTARRELVLDYAGFAFFFYVLFCTLAKLFYVFYSSKISHATNKAFLLTLFFAFVV